MTKVGSDTFTEALRLCETEAIQYVSRIQPHGALVTVAKDPGHTIVQVSSNLGEFFDTSPHRILGRPLSDLINSDQTEAIEELLASIQNATRGSQPIYSVANDEIMELQATVHRIDDVLVIELEPTQTRLDKLGELFNLVRKGLLGLQDSDDIVGYCEGVAEFVRSLTGYNRVMIYRFDHNWEGEVIAESRTTAVTGYLGNRFPAGDIPPQARSLYTRNVLRIVSNIESETVPLIPQTIPGTGKPLDLTYSVLRAFSPVHVEYLRNMQVRASASISILNHGKLWGLVACHHSGPMYITHPVRDILEFVGRIISMKLAGLEASRQQAHSKQLGRTTISVLKHLSAANFASDTIKRHEAEILSLVHAMGALLVLNGKRYLLGTVPDGPDIDALLAWLSQQPENDHFVTDHLASHMPVAERFANSASGCFVTPVSNDMANSLIWFRPERMRTVRWAGKPEKITQADELGQLRISPRKSFACWEETWRYRSDEWYEEEIASGAAFAEVLIDLMVKQH